MAATRKTPLWMEFDVVIKEYPAPKGKQIKLPICGLCGNSGMIDTRGYVKSPRGTPCGILAHCICPNGRHIRRAVRRNERKKETND